MSRSTTAQARPAEPMPSEPMPSEPKPAETDATIANQDTDVERLDSDYDLAHPEVRSTPIALEDIPAETIEAALPNLPAVSTGYAQPHTLTQSELLEMNAIKWWHRIAVGVTQSGEPIYTPGQVDHGPSGGDWPTTRFGLPADLTGKTVLDIGAWDGFFAFEAEKRGAAFVVAADVSPEDGGNWGGTDGFRFAKAMLNSQVEFINKSVYALSSLTTQPKAYDFVLCYGVLYHLKAPLLAIEQLFQAVKPGGTVLIETAIAPGDNLSGWVFAPGKDGDPTNFWYPSRAGLTKALIWAGFTDVEIVSDMGLRMCVRATRPIAGTLLAGTL